MSLNRRHLLIGSAASATLLAAPALAAPTGINATQFGVRPNATDDQTRKLQRAIDESARTRTPLWLPPGLYRAGDINLPAGTQISGTRGKTRLAFARGRSLFLAEHADNISLSGLTFDGGGKTLPKSRALVQLDDVRGLRIADCDILRAGGNGLSLDRCGGEIAQNAITGSAEAALFSNDGLGLTIFGNIVRDSGNNGILVWQSEKRRDGSVVSGNRIENTAARAGGSGQNGNAINVYRAANVTVRDNIIRGAAFSAIRANSASHIRIVGNNCSELDEVAIYSEFEFEDATILYNVIDQAGTGISVTNSKEGGRLATVRGNIVRNIWSRQPGAAPEAGGVGIGIEAETTVSGNTVENAQTAGIAAGWGPYLRDVTVTRNVVRASGIGVAVSVVKGAGKTTIADNVIAGSKRGAIVGMEWHKAVTGDLAVSGAERYPHLRLSGNKVN